MPHLTRILLLLLGVALLSACAGQPAVMPTEPSVGYPVAPTIAPQKGATPFPYPPPSQATTPSEPIEPYPIASEMYTVPVTPVPSDEKMIEGTVFIEGSDILTLESYPPQFAVAISGNLPTPCHQLRSKVSQPDEQNRIYIEVFTLTKPNEMCIQVLKPFEAVIPLGNYPSGKYTIWLNGKQIGEINP